MCTACTTMPEPVDLDFSALCEALFLYGTAQTILFQSGVFYGNPVGQRLFHERYPNGCPQ